FHVALILLPLSFSCNFFLFFFNATATTEIYTLSLHDALPISEPSFADKFQAGRRRLSVNRKSSQLLAMKYAIGGIFFHGVWVWKDRKSTRLNSSHVSISYAVFCLKKKKNSNIYQVIE